MRAAAIYSSILLLAPSVLASDNYCPFVSPLYAGVHSLSSYDGLELRERQDSNCKSGLTSCSNLGAPDTCCPSNTSCQADQAGNVACCSVGATCTGTITGATVSATGSSSSVFIGGGTGTTTNTGSSSSSSFFFGSTTATTTTTTGAVITTGSTVPNALFAFYIIPTTFSGQAECSSYYSGCQSQFTSCTNTLGGGVNGVTVSGGGGGVSVDGVTATAAAASVCSGLSTAACFGLQLSNCPTFGGATATGTNGGNSFIVSTATGAAPTRCPGSFYEIGMGVAVGVAGALI